MGAGKSTIGRVLAAELHLSFRDSDKVIEDRTGADIPWILIWKAKDSDRRSAVLDELSKGQDVVIATGAELFCELKIVKL